jgi:hypothetical protein
MIIAHIQKFIFIPIQKTGSTSIREVLADKYNCVAASSDKTSLIYNHTSACRLKLYFEEQKNNQFSKQDAWNWNEYFKFTFVRNPYARLVSQYNYICKIGSNPQKVTDSNGDEFIYCTEYHNSCKEINKKSFKDFVQNNQYHFDLPYSSFCLDEFDFVGKTENMQTDFDKVIELIRKNNAKTLMKNISIPHLNKSTKKHYSSYYDEETKKIAEEFYGEDIERFNYKFG